MGALEQKGLAFKSTGISAWLGTRNPGTLTIVEAGEVSFQDFYHYGSP